MDTGWQNDNIRSHLFREVFYYIFIEQAGGPIDSLPVGEHMNGGKKGRTIRFGLCLLQGISDQASKGSKGYGKQKRCVFLCQSEKLIGGEIP